MHEHDKKWYNKMLMYRKLLTCFMIWSSSNHPHKINFFEQRSLRNFFCYKGIYIAKDKSQINETRWLHHVHTSNVFSSRQVLKNNQQTHFRCFQETVTRKYPCLMQLESRTFSISCACMTYLKEAVAEQGLSKIKQSFSNKQILQFLP